MAFIDFIGSVQAASVAFAAPYRMGGDSVIDMVHNAGPMVKFVLLVLVILSLACWCVVFVKARLFSKARKESDQFLALYQNKSNFPSLYRETKDLEYGFLPSVFQSGYAEWVRIAKTIESQAHNEADLLSEIWMEGVEKAMEGEILSQRQRMERSLALLATTGSTAPFIGLFGTVWGIMTSFQEIGLKGAANLAVVAPGISEALIATAMGLAAAIPAVVAYNHFVNRVAAFENEMNYFATEFSNLLKREWMRRVGSLKPVDSRRMTMREIATSKP